MRRGDGVIHGPFPESAHDGPSAVGGEESLFPPPGLHFPV